MTVFANKLEVSCKKQANKILAAFPDVCMTPPECPATPPGVPVPYPNFGLDDDTDKGTSTVKIGGETVNQKNKSYFTKTTGDEAGAAAKKGVVSSKNTGKSYSQAFSMNVKAQGKNLTRFSDISTNNHGSPPNVVPWPKIGNPNPPEAGNPCADDIKRVQRECKDKDAVEASCEAAGLGKSVSERYPDTAKDSLTHVSSATSPMPSAAVPKADANFSGSTVKTNKAVQEMSNKAQLDPCLAALVCKLPKYDEECHCKGQTGHHLVPDSSFVTTVAKAKKTLEIMDKDGAQINYSKAKAPVICAEGSGHSIGSHGLMHTEMKGWAQASPSPTTPTPFGFVGGGGASLPAAPYSEVREKAIESVAVVFPLSSCDPACLRAQLDYHHINDLGLKPDEPIHVSAPGQGSEAAQIFSGVRSLMLKWNQRG
ncbi:DUF4150 domain-containing protein [Lentibacter algarum]|uniref:PAAR-like domain-containing protein n=1 Tax=Lentibacter algarum TaxID=576131 RepID=UPI001C072FD1|nr:PAAR-like domain-containing protein [Lentibacter algarum]MBU2980557.1 DUF4150 domain-containing protein [Lentibacter algarum]